MFIIWGTRNTEKVLGYLGTNFECGHCNNVSHYKAFCRKTWFTLFWIPIFPISVNYFVTCPVCNYGKKITKAEAQEMMEKHGTMMLNNSAGMS